LSPAKEQTRSQVLFENERVRVLELRLPPRQIEPTHTHPHFMVCVLSAAKVRITTIPDCHVSEVEVKPGDVFWKEPVTHIGENIGDTELHELIVEFKGFAETEA
jgi:quercetin dioxygenase-like cupin family protein